MFAFTAVIFLGGCAPSNPVAHTDEKSNMESAHQAALERTRKQVRMLDTIYKGSIVTLTQEYVDGDEATPAGTMFKKIFAMAKEGGFHECRLIDATGDAYNDENVPTAGFEEEAIAALKSGESWYEAETTDQSGQKVLKVATMIPVALDKCVDCHSHYEDFRNGEAIGALAYTIPIE